jgi:glycosyltransferase involved in cell wall biosynthesis
MDKRVLIITDFPELEYQENSGTPALKYFVDALSKEVTTTIVTPTRAPRKLNWFRWVRSISKDCYDVDLVYGAGCTSAYIAAKLGRKYGIPSVGRLYGTYLYPHLHNPIQLTIKFEETLAFKARCTRYVITNDGTRGNDVAEHFGIPPEDLYFWRNGVDVPERTVYNNSVPIIVSLARLEKWKRVDRIIKAFNSCLYLDAKLYIIGDGPERDNLMKLAGHNLGKKIFFMGQVSRDKALHCLNRADIFISTNDYSNVSNSLLQAMSLGKCCIVLDSGEEIIEHGVTGVVADDEEALPYHLQAVTCSPGLRTRLGIDAMCYAAEHFESWESRINMEVELIKEML